MRCPEARASSIARVRALGLSRQFVRWENITLAGGAPGETPAHHTARRARRPSLHQNLGITTSRKIPTAPEAAKFWCSNTDVGLLARQRFSLAPPTPDSHSAQEHCPASRDGSRAPSLARTFRAVA